MMHIKNTAVLGLDALWHRLRLYEKRTQEMSRQNFDVFRHFCLLHESRNKIYILLINEDYNDFNPSFIPTMQGLSLIRERLLIFIFKNTQKIILCWDSSRGGGFWPLGLTTCSHPQFSLEQWCSWLCLSWLVPTPLRSPWLRSLEGPIVFNLRVHLSNEHICCWKVTGMWC